METYASKACILQFSEHGKPQALSFFEANSEAEEWHIVPAYVSAETTGLK